MGDMTGGVALSFPDIDIGYGVFSNRITKTTNFGDNWNLQIPPTIMELISISFPNVNTGYACGAAGTLVKTTNAGDNWFIIYPLPPPYCTNFYFVDVCFMDTLNGYIAGYRATGDSSIFIKTTNGGFNWTIQLYTISNWGKFTAMSFLNPSTGYIGSTGYILKTTSGGNWGGWNNIFVPTYNRIYTIHFPSASTGYASCHGGQILKTTNGGNNWFLQTTGTGSILYSIFFINDLTGYVSGDNNTILKTTNGGGPPIGYKTDQQ